MRGARGIAALLAALLALNCAAWCAAEGAPAGVPEVERVVEALFAAAAGTTAEEERSARAEMTEEQRELRNAQNAAYRAQVLPWLEEALRPEADGVQGAQPAEGAAGTALDAEAVYALFAGTPAGRGYIALMEARGCRGAEDCLLGTKEAMREWLAKIDAERLSEINADYACWIYCADSRIDYPVVQGADNSHYLQRLFDGTHNACGTLFVECRNLPGFRDPNTLIYGHHMRDGSMFKSITYYAEQAYYESHPYMLILAPTERYLVEVIAGYTAREDDHCYDIAISGAESMAEFAEQARGKSDFAAQVEIGEGDRLVTLSTCAYLFKNARYVVIGRLATLWKMPAE